MKEKKKGGEKWKDREGERGREGERTEEEKTGMVGERCAVKCWVKER